MGAVTPLLAGTVLSSASRIYGGMKEQAADNFAAQQFTTEGQNAVAAGEQGAFSQLRRGAYVASNARGLTAGSGLATTSPSAVANQGQIMGESEYAARSAIYSGQSEQALDLAKAGALKREGSAAATAGWVGGISSVLSGGGGFYRKYGSPFNYNSWGSTPLDYSNMTPTIS